MKPGHTEEIKSILARSRECRTRLREPKEQRRVVDIRRKELVLPTFDRDRLAGLLDDFDRVVAEADSAEVKGLLQRLVTRVVVQDRARAEVWYAVPGGEAVPNAAAPTELSSEGRPSVASGANLIQFQRFPRIMKLRHLPPAAE